MSVVCFEYLFVYVFFFKQKTAYEMRISDWSSDVCSSDLFLRTGPVCHASSRRASRCLRSKRAPLICAPMTRLLALLLALFALTLPARAADDISAASRSVVRDRKSTRLNSSH